jgi:thioredoxin 1
MFNSHILTLCFQVSAVPVLIAFKNGKVQERLVGLQDVDKLRKFVNSVVDGK